jgi:type IV secretion system protein VirD4
LIDTAKIKRHVLPLLPYVFLFWFFNKVAEAVRTAPGRDMLQKAMYGIGNLGNAFASPLPSFDLIDLGAGFLGAAAIYGIVLYKKKNAKKWRKDMEYGSARWGVLF